MKYGFAALIAVIGSLLAGSLLAQEPYQDVSFEAQLKLIKAVTPSVCETDVPGDGRARMAYEALVQADHLMTRLQARSSAIRKKLERGSEGRDPASVEQSAKAAGPAIEEFVQLGKQAKRLDRAISKLRACQASALGGGQMANPRVDRVTDEGSTLFPASTYSR